MLINRWFGILISFLVLVVFNLISYFKDVFYFTSAESYFHLLRYNYFDNFLYFFLTNSAFDRFFILFLGFLFLVFFSFVLSELGFKDKTVFYSLILVSISPFFIYMYTSILPISLAALLVVLHIYLFIRKSYFSVFLVPLIFFSSYVLGLFYFLLFLCFGFVNLNIKKIRFFYFSLSIFVLSIIYFFKLDYFLYEEVSNFFVFFIEVGFLYSISIPLIILGICGVYISWKRTLNNNLLILFFVLSFFIGFLFREVFLFFGLVLVVYSSIFINSFISRDWNVELIKNFFVITIICVFLFSVLSFNYLSLQKHDVNSLRVLESFDDGLVLSSLDNGFAISYFSGKDVFLDSFSFLDSNFSYKFEDFEVMLFSRDLEEVSYLFEKHNISYVFVTNDMRDRVWFSRNDGLLFLFNTQRFERIYYGDEVSIYEFISS
ncbi:MAG: hypothetical protein ACMXX7_01395 [Candidatus Woesearchaeota archaeon]